MLKIDQLVIGEIGSFDEFEASVKERVINTPKKKSIKETVPFSNKTYDFSAINGELYWEERSLEYVFEIIADTPEELEEKKQPFISWLMNVQEEEIYDPFIEDYHFVGTFESVDIDDTELEKATIKATFSAYPYQIANRKKVIEVEITTGESVIEFLNESSHRIMPTFVSDVEFTLLYKNTSYGFPSGENSLRKIMLDVGSNTMSFKAVEERGVVNIEFFEEVF